MMISDNLVAIIAIICCIGLPVALGMYMGLASSRASHKERMKLVEQGIIPPSPKQQATPSRFVALRNGIMLVCLGLGFVVGHQLGGSFKEGQTAFFTMAASILFFLGLGYLVYFFIMWRIAPTHTDEEEQRMNEQE